MRWTLKPQPSDQKVQQLASALGVSEKITYLLVQRGIETYDQAKAFFRPNLRNLHDPFLMKDMTAAVNRIEQAIRDEEKILIYGDYDVDGTTSVALLYTFLQKYTSLATTYIPDRYVEGYGISYKGIDYAADNDITLIIALDCGIKATQQIEYASEKGIDFIICDHHLPGAEIPKAVAVLDPKREDCPYPFDELCGCGIGFKLIQALTQNRGEGFDQLIPFLDLVAVAIGSDIVPLVGENRILAFHGLRVLNKNPRAGFRAIIKSTKKDQFNLTDVVFIIGPRINAAGRMKHALHAVNLLTETDLDKAEKLAAEIESYNGMRRSTDQDTTLQALEQIEKHQEQKKLTTVVYQANWHKGVIGIVASRLTETYYRPTLVFTKSGDKLAASARSISGFNIYKAIEACAEYLEQFGGHKYAAGLTLLEDQYEAFKEKFEEVVADTLNRKLLEPEIQIDMKLALHEITPSFCRILKQFAPFGPGNSKPAFYAKNVTDTGYAKTVGKDGDHLKCVLFAPQSSYSFPAIGFGLGEKLATIKSAPAFEIVYSLDENQWNNKTEWQLNLKDLR